LTAADEKAKELGKSAVDKTKNAIHGATAPTKKMSDVTEDEFKNFSYTHLNTRNMSPETRRILTAYYKN
jgi:hypothetical protein